MNRQPSRGTSLPGRFARIVPLFLLGAGPAFAVAPEPGLSALEVPLPARAVSIQPFAEGVPPAAREALVGATATSWRGTWDAAAGHADRLFPAGYRLAMRGDGGSAIDERARAFLGAHPDLFGAAPADLETLPVDLRGGIYWVTYQETLGGLPVLGARLDLRVNEEGFLLYVQDRTLGGLSLPPSGISVTEAEARAAAALEALGVAVRGIAAAVPGITDLGATSEVIVPIFDPATGRAEARRAWRVRQDVSAAAPARFRSYVDASTGEILGRENEIFYAAAEGTVQGDEQPLTPTDPYTRAPFEDLRVNVDGIGSVFTDESGAWSLDFPDGNQRAATARLDGRFCNVNRQDGPDAQISGNAQPGVPLPLVFQDGNSQASERDVFFHVNLARDYIKGIDPAFTGVDYEMPALVNIAQTCNAYWDGFAVNFFQAGGGCANTGQIADVIYHEYGHGITQYTYAPASPSGAEHEGFSDYYAATITDQSKIGLGFFGPGTWLRDCNNDRQWPANECGGEVHCVGEVIAGALWHMRENLIGELGDHDAAVTLANHLFHFARYGRSNEFEGYYFDLLAVDDDNGTLVDGTPHAGSIIQAFDRHNIGPGFVLEIIHTPLHDTDRANQPIPVTGVFSSAVPLEVDSLAVYYTTQSIFGGIVHGPTRLQMSPAGGIREYTANIPGQPLNTLVRYYLSGYTAELGLHDTDPDGAPASQHGFVVAIDLTAPVIAHEQKTERSRHVWPVPIRATVTDNQAVGTVRLEYRVNGADRAPVLLDQQEGNLYTGMFGGSVAVGDVVEYRIKAQDAAQTPNVAYLPASGYYSIPIVRDVVDDVEDGIQEWTHRNSTAGFVDQWHQSTRRNHTPGGATSWKFGSTGNGSYADGAEGVLEMLPVALGPGASMSFWHWIAAEEDAGGQAWDGALVEISTDDGASWGPLQPVGGYTHQIIANPASPFPPGYPVWSGSHDWQQAQFDLSAYAGQRIRLRWRFGSDGFVAYEGWYVDDLNLVTTTDETVAVGDSAGLLPARTALLGATPNPFNPRTAIRFAVAPGSGSVRVSIHDVTGRLVRMLAEGDLPAGFYERVWDGLDDRSNRAATGVYFVRIHARGAQDAAKLLLVK